MNSLPNVARQLGRRGMMRETSLRALSKLCSERDSVLIRLRLLYLLDQVIREDPAGAVVVRAWPGHRNIGRGSCRSALADGVEHYTVCV